MMGVPGRLGSRPGTHVRRARRKSGKHPQTPVTAGAPPTDGGRGHRPSAPADGNETARGRTTGPAPAPEPQPPTGPQTADKPRPPTLPSAARIFAPDGRETARQPSNRR